MSSYFKVLGIGTCTCRYFPAEYSVFEVSVKSGIGAALITMVVTYVLAQQGKSGYIY